MSSPVYVYGKHPVMEALKLRADTLSEIWLTPTLSESEYAGLAKRHALLIRTLDEVARQKILSPEAVDQGVVAALLPEKLILKYEAYISGLQSTPGTLLVVFGEIQDPQNVGAMIRSASALGASAVLIPDRNQSPLTGAAIKVSAGAAFQVPLVSIGNVNQTLADLKKRGFWTYGLAGAGDTSLTSEIFDKPTVLVVGNEGKGIREKTLETCDFSLSIPISKRSESLNAATALALALYRWSSQHPESLE